MKHLDYQKEITPVVYDESSIKVSNFFVEPFSLAFRPHWHSRLEVLRITSGELTLNINGESIVAKKDSVVIVNPYLSHTGVTDKKSAGYTVVSFDINNFLNSSVATTKYLAPILEQKILLNSLVEEPYFLAEIDKIIEHSKTNPLFAVSAVYMFLGQFFSNNKYKQSQKTNNNQRIYKVTEYLNKHFCDDINLEFLSRKFSYNEAYLCQKFKESTGLTIVKYINILRIEKAQDLLKNTDKQISEIAFLCGFNDFIYFSHCFKKYLKISPTEFRKISRQKN